MSSGNVGPISVYARDRLSQLGIPIDETHFPQSVQESDFKNADRVIALEEREHEPMVRALFPNCLEKTEFWDIADIEFRAPADALAELESCVRHLVATLEKQ